MATQASKPDMVDLDVQVLLNALENAVQQDHLVIVLANLVNQYSSEQFTTERLHNAIVRLHNSWARDVYTHEG